MQNLSVPVSQCTTTRRAFWILPLLPLSMIKSFSATDEKCILCFLFWVLQEFKIKFSFSTVPTHVFRHSLVLCIDVGSLELLEYREVACLSGLVRGLCNVTQLLLGLGVRVGSLLRIYSICQPGSFHILLFALKHNPTHNKYKAHRRTFDNGNCGDRLSTIAKANRYSRWHSNVNKWNDEGSELCAPFSQKLEKCISLLSRSCPLFWYPVTTLLKRPVISCQSRWQGRITVLVVGLCT